MAEEDKFEDFWKVIRPKRGLPVERPAPEATKTERAVTHRPEVIPLVDPERVLMSQAVHRRVQAVTAQVLRNYIGMITDGTSNSIIHQVANALMSGPPIMANGREETASTTEPAEEGLGSLLTHAGVAEANYSQDFRNEGRTLTLTFTPQLGGAAPRVGARIDGMDRPVVTIAFDLTPLQRTVYSFEDA